ncbi:MAG: hypothetical protein HQK79_19955 [Desulfobacterales bacterium]|nr:hypothetical protein [Desulfobacterales bacterium]
MSKWKKQGYKDGQYWAKELRIDELRKYIEELPTLREYDQLWPNGFVYEECRENYHKDPDWWKDPGAPKAYWEAFASGAENIWEEY